jgi:hypothetical protein
MKIEIDDIQKELCQLDEEGRAYLEYNDKVGGEPIGLTVPFGYPEGVDEMGGVIAVYKECIRQNKTWQELLGVNDQIDDDVIV